MEWKQIEKGKKMQIKHGMSVENCAKAIQLSLVLYKMLLYYRNGAFRSTLLYVRLEW